MLKIHKKIIKEVVEKNKTNPKIIAILLFGSLAKGTANNKSDVDIEIIYTGNKWKEANEHINGIKVDYEYWPYKQLIKKLDNSPYLCYPYTYEKVLYDKNNFAKKLKLRVKRYFRENKEIETFWGKWEKEYLINKKRGKKIKDVNIFYKELKKKFSK